MVLFLISMLSHLGILYWAGLALIIYTYWRMMSKNVSKRYAENQKFLNIRYQWTVKRNNIKKLWAQRGMYRFYRCPQCRQTVRVPKGKGKICITCPKCRTEFVKKS
jgi:ssDNA-binding Zn-finger/Zn-ribbon topoisomerase 1